MDWLWSLDVLTLEDIREVDPGPVVNACTLHSLANKLVLESCKDLTRGVDVVSMLKHCVETEDGIGTYWITWMLIMDLKLSLEVQRRVKKDLNPVCRAWTQDTPCAEWVSDFMHSYWRI
jgi:hypothetical protein